jgi:flagellar assembly factor FliW
MASGCDGPASDAPESGTEETVEVTTERFGTVEAPSDRVIRMISPIFGFARSKRYVVLPSEDEDSPFGWLQSLDEPGLAFIVINPFQFFPAYDIELPTPDQRELELESADECVILAIVTIPAENPRGLTANLVAPLVINSRTRSARQVVLYESGYFTKHPLLPEEDAGPEVSAEDAAPEAD